MRKALVQCKIVKWVTIPAPTHLVGAGLCDTYAERGTDLSELFEFSRNFTWQA